MKELSAGRQDTGWMVRLLSNQHIRVAAAALVLASGALATRGAYAQDASSCVEKCKAEEKQCLNNGSSEELCDYDSKGCQKSCTESK